MILLHPIPIDGELTTVIKVPVPTMETTVVLLPPILPVAFSVLLRPVWSISFWTNDPPILPRKDGKNDGDEKIENVRRPIIENEIVVKICFVVK